MASEKPVDSARRPESSRIVLGESNRFHADGANDDDAFSDDTYVTLEPEVGAMCVYGITEQAFASALQSCWIALSNIHGNAACLALGRGKGAQALEGAMNGLVLTSDEDRFASIVNEEHDRGHFVLACIVNPYEYPSICRDSIGRSGGNVEQIEKLIRSDDVFLLICAENTKKVKEKVAWCDSDIPHRVLLAGNPASIRLAMTSDAGDKIKDGQFNVIRSNVLKAYYYNRDTNKLGRMRMYPATMHSAAPSIGEVITAEIGTDPNTSQERADDYSEEGTSDGYGINGQLSSPRHKNHVLRKEVMMKFGIEKMIVAADDGEPAINIADSIAALRSCLDEPAPSTPIPPLEDTESIHPIPPCGIAGVELDRDSPSSIGNTGVSVSVPKLVVGANDTSVTDQIAAMRDMLENGEGIKVFRDGTFANPGTPATDSSIANGEPMKTVPKQIVGTQWYEQKPDMMKIEIAAMADMQPNAKYDFLPNGKMYWQLQIHPDIAGVRKHWVFLAVYDEDHPQKRWGGSVKFYPVKPNYQDMCEMVEKSSVTPKHIPHLLTDDNDQIYMCTQNYKLILAGRKKGERISSAATGLRFAIVWANYFEYGLLDQKIWTLFQREISV